MAGDAGENRFSPITPDNHAGSVWIAALLCLVYSIITLALRAHLRRKMYGFDDYLALAATVQMNCFLRGLELMEYPGHSSRRGCYRDRWTQSRIGSDAGSSPSKRVGEGQSGELGLSMIQRSMRLLIWSGDVCESDSLYSRCRRSESVHPLSDDEALQPQWSQVTESRSVKNSVLGWSGRSRGNGTLGTSLNRCTLGRLFRR